MDTICFFTSPWLIIINNFENFFWILANSFLWDRHFSCFRNLMFLIYGDSLLTICIYIYRFWASMEFISNSVILFPWENSLWNGSTNPRAQWLRDRDAHSPLGRVSVEVSDKLGTLGITARLMNLDTWSNVIRFFVHSLLWREQFYHGLPFVVLLVGRQINNKGEK